MVFGLAVAFVSGFVASSIAQSKGHSGFPYFVLGFLLPLIGILAAGLMAPVEPAKKIQSANRLDSGDLSLADLRPVGDRKTEAFLSGYRQSMTVAIRACEAGELVLAFGRGTWGVMPVVFMLTDRQLIIVKEGATRAKSVRPLDGIALSEDGTEVVFADGAVRPASSSPFTATEVVSLTQERDRSSKQVAVTGPGLAVVDRKPEPSEPPRHTIDELERLDALHQSGAIDDAEFAELKRRLVWGEDGTGAKGGQSI